MALETVQLLLLLVPLAISLGPATASFAAMGVTGGFSAAWRALVGYNAAAFFAVLAVGYGLEHSVLADGSISRFLRIASAVVMFWLAWAFLTARSLNAAPTESSRSFGFVGGALLMALNPKGYAVIGLTCAQFLGPGRSVLLLATVFALVHVLCFGAWVAAGSILGRLFSRPERAAAINTAMGLMMFAGGLWILAA